MATDSPLGSIRPPAPSRRPDLLLAATLALLIMSWSWTIEGVFDRAQVFQQYDVLFNADPVARLSSIAHGKSDGNDVFIHPGFNLYFSRLIRLAGRIAHLSGAIPPTPRAEHVLRRSLALLVIPAVSGLSMATAYALFAYCGLTRLRALMMTLLCCVSFSQLIFGSLPDHMALSNLLITALLLLAREMAARERPVRWASWAVLGGLYAGTTLTNSVPLIILFATTRVVSGRAWRLAAIEVILVTLAMLAVTATLATGGCVVARTGKSSVEKLQHHATSYLKCEPHKIPIALLETFTPAALERRTLPPTVVAWNRGNSGRANSKSFDTCNAGMPVWILGLFVLTLLSGVYAWWRERGEGRAVCAGALGVTAFHLGLHSLWGDAPFLYSQHWLVPAALLLAGNLTWPGNIGRACTAVYGAAGVWMFFHNGGLLTEIFNTLAVSS